MGVVTRKNQDKAAPEFRAVHWNAKISPHKARLVVDRVRYLPVSEALSILKFDRHRGAYLIDRVLKLSRAVA
jgi:ribosomal protein L22